MSQVHTYLSKDDYERLSQICEAEGCTPYMLAKVALLDKIHGYPLKTAGPEPTAPPPPTTEAKARGIADDVRQRLRGDTHE